MRRKLRRLAHGNVPTSSGLGPVPDQAEQPRRLPKGIALGVALVFVLALAPSASASIQFVKQWGSQGSVGGQFNSPYHVATDSSGNVYVADAGNNRIQKFDSSGNFLTAWGSSGSGDGQFNFP